MSNKVGARIVRRRPLLTVQRMFRLLPLRHLLLFATLALFGTVEAAGWTAFNGMTRGCNGVVHAMAASSDGRIALGGEFTLCGNVPVNNIVIYDVASNSWSSPGSGVTATPGSGVVSVQALAWFGGDLYAGGQFTHAGGAPNHDLARWNGSQWSDPTGGTQLLRIDALAADTNHLYVGGSFQNIGGISAEGIARWNGSSWENLGSGVPGTVYAIELDGADLYVGGQFNTAGGQPAKNVARWSGGAWTSLGSGSANGTNTFVWALRRWGGALYVGGDFTLAGGASARRIARWTGSAWEALAGNGTNGVNATVRELIVHEGALVVGGQFTQVVGQNSPVSRAGTGMPGASTRATRASSVPSRCKAAGCMRAALSRATAPS